jgi:hypothetical protein
VRREPHSLVQRRRFLAHPQRMASQPQGASRNGRVHTSIPPSGFVATAVHLAMVPAAEWNGEFIADLTAECSTLRKAKVGIDDHTISSLGRVLLPALNHPDQASQLFVDHLFAIGVHIAQTYGGMRPLSPPVQGGLASWQVRRAKENLSANLDGRLLIEEVGRNEDHGVQPGSLWYPTRRGAPVHQTKQSVGYLRARGFVPPVVPLVSR